MSEEFSIQDSEELIGDFKNITQGPFSDLASVLRDLSSLSSLAIATEPPLYPSQVTANVLPIKPAHRFGVTTMIVFALAASATLGAAAVVGIPDPISRFAKNSVHVVQKAVQTMADVVTGNHSEAAKILNQNSTSTAPDQEMGSMDEITPSIVKQEDDKPLSETVKDNHNHPDMKNEPSDPESETPTESSDQKENSSPGESESSQTGTTESSSSEQPTESSSSEQPTESSSSIQSKVSEKPGQSSENENSLGNDLTTETNH